MMNRHNRQVLFATALIVDHLIVIVDLGVVQLRKTMGQLNQCFIIRIRNNSMLNACDNIRTKLVVDHIQIRHLITILLDRFLPV